MIDPIRPVGDPAPPDPFAAQRDAAAAHRAITRARTLLQNRAAGGEAAGPGPDARLGTVRMRYVGNCLNELDRLLHVFLDELAPALRITPAPGQTNTANKIETLAGLNWTAAPDRSRLRALGRSRACFSHCAGVARRADERGGGWMTSGWLAPRAPATLLRYRIGEPLTPGEAELAEIASFYETLADRLSAIPPR